MKGTHSLYAARGVQRHSATLLFSNSDACIEEPDARTAFLWHKHSCKNADLCQWDDYRRLVFHAAYLEIAYHFPPDARPLLQRARRLLSFSESTVQQNLSCAKRRVYETFGIDRKDANKRQFEQRAADLLKRYNTIEEIVDRIMAGRLHA